MTEEQELEVKRLEVNMSRLLTCCDRMQEQILALQTERDQLRSALEQATAKLEQSQQQVVSLTTARALEGYTGGAKEAHAMVCQLIDEVQECIRQLSQLSVWAER